jgi:hypothetical protein
MNSVCEDGSQLRRQMALLDRPGRGKHEARLLGRTGRTKNLRASPSFSYQV